MKKGILNKIKALVRGFAKTRQSGVALVITMLIMLVLVLISLSLVMQSNTENLISQNEQDSFHALSDAEGSIDYANRIVRSYILTYRPTDLSPILQGQLNAGTVSGGATCSGTCPKINLVGFKPTLNTTLNESGLTYANEKTTSGIVTGSEVPGLKNFNTSDEWEVFRVGVDADNDGHYDGNIRTLVYARLYDNYDPSQDTTDTDMRMRLEVRTVYPVYVDLDNNAAEVSTMANRGQAVRHLTARFGPTGSNAIRTDGNLDMHGSFEVCGECGSAHANGTMQYRGGATACGDITGTAGFQYQSGTIMGDSGTIPAVYIPIVNPYNDEFVPKPSDFDHTSDGTLPAWLQCTGPSTNDVGNSKYFAMVKLTNNTYQIYKAYPNYGDATNTGNKWVWRLIADNNVGLDSVTLDNCGRVVTCDASINCFPDQIFDTVSSTWSVATGGVSPESNSFYGWAPDHSWNTSACYGSQTETIQPNEYDGAQVDGLSGRQNDWVENNFSQFSGHSSGSGFTKPQSDTDASGNRHLNFCTASGCSFVLPGGGNALNNGLGDNGVSPAADFDTTTYIRNGDWTNGNNIYSPLYNSVLFFIGRVPQIAGNGGSKDIHYYQAGQQTTSLNGGSFQFNNTWRTTIIATGTVSMSGTVNINPPFSTSSNYRWAVVSGRDIQMNGNADSFACDTTDCDATLSGTIPTFAGAILAHEQISFQGTPGINGFVIAEDRAGCSRDVTSTESVVGGNPQIHYDCINPADPWAILSVRVQNWEENQRVQ